MPFSFSRLLGHIGSALGSVPSGIGSMGFTNALAAGQALAGLGLSFAGKNAGPQIMNPYDTNWFQASWDQQQQANEQEAQLQEEQAQIALTEAGAEARQKAQEVQSKREQQALQYTGAGVLLEGSPMLVLEETRRRGQQEVNAIMNRGVALNDLMRRKADILRNEGRATLLGQQAQFMFNKSQFDAQQKLNALGTGGFDPSNIFNAVSTLANLFGSYKKPLKPPPQKPPQPNTVKPPWEAGPTNDPNAYKMPPPNIMDQFRF